MDSTARRDKLRGLRKPALIAILAVLVILAIARRPHQSNPEKSTQPTAAVTPESIKARIEPALAQADRESQAAVVEVLRPLADFFADARSGTDAFADAALGWSSKWRLVVDKLPFTRNDRHDTFLREALEEHVFRASDLATAIEQATRGYADRLTAIENRLLVRLREDLDDLPPQTLATPTDPETLAAAYNRAMQEAMQHVGADVGADVATLLVSLVSQEVLAQVAVRLGASAGVLAVGAGSSWATFGIGLVVGVIVDQIITWVWDWYADPEGTLSAELKRRLDQLHTLIVEGDDQTTGLRQALSKFASQRAAVRRRAVLSLFGFDDKVDQIHVQGYGK